MKELKISLTLSFLLTIGHLYSQGLEIELLGGPAFTSLRGNDDIKDNFDGTINFSTGLGINYLYNVKSVLSFAVLYDKKGGGSESNVVLRDVQNQIIGEGKVSTKANYEYITIPIQLGQRFGKKIRYQYGIGLYTSLLLKQEVTRKGLDGLVNISEDNTDNCKKVDLGLAASFSVFIPIKDSFSIKMGLSNNVGLINTSELPVKNDGTIKHNSLGLLVGLNFRVN